MTVNNEDMEEVIKPTAPCNQRGPALVTRLQLCGEMTYLHNSTPSCIFTSGLQWLLTY